MPVPSFPSTEAENYVKTWLATTNPNSSHTTHHCDSPTLTHDDGLGKNDTQLSCDIPLQIYNQINRHIEAFISRTDVTSIVEDLPHPTRNPLTCQQHLCVKNVINKYCDVMETRDLYWVYRLILENQQPAQRLDQFPLFRDKLVEVRMAVANCEDAISYLTDWCKLHGLRINFTKVERLRRDVLPDYHACKLIKTFIEGTPHT